MDVGIAATWIFFGARRTSGTLITNGWAFCGRDFGAVTFGSVTPASTCALVITRPGANTKPEPSICREHDGAMPRICTTEPFTFATTGLAASAIHIVPRGVERPFDSLSVVSFDFDRVELSDVSRHYGRRRAVSHVSLAARAGDIVGLLGPNGAGKSTLIGMMATLVTPSISWGTTDKYVTS